MIFIIITSVRSADDDDDDYSDDHQQVVDTMMMITVPLFAAECRVLSSRRQTGGRELPQHNPAVFLHVFFYLYLCTHFYLYLCTYFYAYIYDPMSRRSWKMTNQGVHSGQLGWRRAQNSSLWVQYVRFRSSCISPRSFTCNCALSFISICALYFNQ